MFAGFGFDWPDAIIAIYDAFSIANFNFDLLAPECSVSLTFESKWCVDTGVTSICLALQCVHFARWAGRPRPVS